MKVIGIAAADAVVLRIHLVASLGESDTCFRSDDRPVALTAVVMSPVLG